MVDAIVQPHCHNSSSSQHCSCIKSTTYQMRTICWLRAPTKVMSGITICFINNTHKVRHLCFNLLSMMTYNIQVLNYKLKIAYDVMYYWDCMSLKHECLSLGVYLYTLSVWTVSFGVCVCVLAKRPGVLAKCQKIKSMRLKSVGGAASIQKFQHPALYGVIKHMAKEIN